VKKKKGNLLYEKNPYVLKLTVDARGKITQVENVIYPESGIAQIIAEAIKRGPDWIPARQNGKEVKSVRQVSFRFN
jgi:hypothetical protein